MLYICPPDLRNSCIFTPVAHDKENFRLNRGFQLLMSNSWYPESFNICDDMFVVYKIIFNREHSDVRASLIVAEDR